LSFRRTESASGSNSTSFVAMACCGPVVCIIGVRRLWKLRTFGSNNQGFGAAL
jgi:hypothetical protein